MMLDEDETHGMHRMRPAHLLAGFSSDWDGSNRACGREARPRVGDTNEHIGGESAGEAKKEGGWTRTDGKREERKDAGDREKRRNSN